MTKKRSEENIHTNEYEHSNNYSLNQRHKQTGPNDTVTLARISHSLVIRDIPRYAHPKEAFQDGRAPGDGHSQHENSKLRLSQIADQNSRHGQTEDCRGRSSSNVDQSVLNNHENLLFFDTENG